MDLRKVHNVYFLGIGGIGMSALARYFSFHEITIYGYDLNASPLTRQLEREGMIIHYETDIASIPSNIDFAVYTPAIPDDNIEYQFLIQSGISTYKRSAIIGKVTENYFTIAIAGTHGKTSISALTAHLLHHNGIKITALVGGIMKNFNSNFVTSSGSKYFIIEADEYDRSFLQLKPELAVISSMDADHLDIYENKENLGKGFKCFVDKIKENGFLVSNERIPRFSRQTLTYGFSEAVDLKAANVHVSNGKFVFDLVHKSGKIKGIEMAIPGYHYIENALAAAAIGLNLNLTDKQIKAGLQSFAGVERRFDLRINTGKKVYIDDYAHHPAEIDATINAVKTLFPDKKLTGVFQPHLYSRTRDLAKEFALSLEALDKIILLPIYPAREKPIAGITSETILKKIKKNDKMIVSRNELINLLKNIAPEVLITMGAGDIGLMTTEIEKTLNS